MSEKLAIDGGTPITDTPIPEGPLGPEDIGQEEIDAVTAVLKRKQVFRFLMPEEESEVARLEADFRTYTGSQHALAVSGGTCALISALTGIGISVGDEVIVPGYTYVASAAAILIQGGIPVIAEIDESLTMDPADVERKITPQTRAIMPVHMRGTPCRMDELMAIAKKHNLLVIEDTAQACGGFYKGKALGSFGDVGCFSLQHYKVITAGEGGIVITDNRDVYDRAALRHDSAMIYWKPDESRVKPFPGANFRMDEMQGALGRVQFSRMEGILGRTRAVKKRILAGIADTPGITLQDVPDPEGDCALMATFYTQDKPTAIRFAEALCAEGVPAGALFSPMLPDRHVYCYWEYVMEKLSADRHGWPWTSPFYKGNVEYSPDMCPRTLDILGRTVVIGLNQRIEDHQADQAVEAVKKVARALA